MAKPNKKEETLRDVKKYKYFIILPDDPFKVRWEYFMTLPLILVFFMTPYRLAFVKTESTFWIILDASIDFLFFLDIVLNFFMAYYNEDFILIDKRS